MRIRRYLATHTGEFVLVDLVSVLNASAIACFAGIAANELLDITAAEGHFRAAWNLAVASVGVHSYAAQLSGALLGDLLYQQGTCLLYTSPSPRD